VTTTLPALLALAILTFTLLAWAWRSRDVLRPRVRVTVPARTPRRRPRR
jgi:hypothetical protein